MPRRRKPSVQAIALFQAFLARPGGWRYGYDLAKEAGLQSGTLYPLLMRLTDEGFLESEWHPPSRQGLPPRHAYRLTRAGTIFALANLEAVATPSGGPSLAPA